jgi:hypothetical protein
LVLGELEPELLGPLELLELLELELEPEYQEPDWQGVQHIHTKIV